MAEVDRLVGSNDEDWPWDDSDEEDEEESDEEEEDVEEKCEEEEVASNHEEESKTAEECGKLCITTVFEEGKVDKPILPVKCEDPGPCLVTCEHYKKSGLLSRLKTVTTASKNRDNRSIVTVSDFTSQFSVV
ncbi:hypothetical protein PIB30_077137 [Stylosanthes scabra]|uniref:Uncharacterized protein n=1 Tax=Stylosanthes scabra TaxID=79078 RepID=A0ABU6VRN3_9FABA|nr:hypothetical protein [Stylosanthes scabra]